MNQDERELLIQKIAEANQKVLKANTERDEAFKKLAEYEKITHEAENARRMKSLFLANMSHEIRTPLNAIEGFARIMAETDSQEERMQFLEIIESNNNRLLNLINEILDLSRVESGELVFKKEDTDLNDLFSSIKHIFKFRCNEHDSNRIAAYGHGIWSPVSSVTLKARFKNPSDIPLENVSCLI